MENKCEIYAALAAVMADVGSVGKNKVNKQQGFKFRSIDDVYNALHPALSKNKVVIVPNVLERTSTVIGKTVKGADMVKVVCNIEFTFYAQDGSYIKTVIVGEGLDTGDKATSKAMAMAYKYLCFQVFCIPIEGMTDPDAESIEKDPENKTGNKQESEATSKITEAMLKTIKAEQMRTGVVDEAILRTDGIYAKTLRDLTVSEFKIVMDRFSATPDL